MLHLVCQGMNKNKILYIRMIYEKEFRILSLSFHSSRHTPNTTDRYFPVQTFGITFFSNNLRDIRYI